MRDLRSSTGRAAEGGRATARLDGLRCSVGTAGSEPTPRRLRRPSGTPGRSVGARHLAEGDAPMTRSHRPRHRRQPRHRPRHRARSSSPRATGSPSPRASGRAPRASSPCRPTSPTPHRSTPPSPRSRPSSAPSRSSSRTPASPRTRSCCACRRRTSTSVVDTNLGGAFRVVKRASKGMLQGALRPHHPDLERRRAARLRRPGELRLVEGRARRLRPLAHPRARRPRHHRERRRARASSRPT